MYAKWQSPSRNQWKYCTKHVSSIKIYTHCVWLALQKKSNCCSRATVTWMSHGSHASAFRRTAGTCRVPVETSALKMLNVTCWSQINCSDQMLVMHQTPFLAINQCPLTTTQCQFPQAGIHACWKNENVIKIWILNWESKLKLHIYRACLRSIHFFGNSLCSCNAMQLMCAAELLDSSNRQWAAIQNGKE